MMESRLANREFKEYSLDEIKNMPNPHTVVTTIACAGNRRRHTKVHYPDVKGLNWDVGAVSNAKYRGVLVRDLLLASGFTQEELDGDMLKNKHLVATGMDTDFQGVPYSISIPLERALDPKNEVILAYEMNNEPIIPDHGYPLRLICPGYIGVRHCKWVQKLEISDQEATYYVQRRDYKWIEEKDWSKINPEDYPSINGIVSYACITNFKTDQEVKVNSR